jgi:hypothetical protein
MLPLPRSKGGLLRTRDAALLIIPEDYESETGGYHELEPADAKRLRDAIAEARRHVEKAHAAVPRTELLFGPDSDASKSANTMVGTLRHILDVLAEERPGEISYAEGKLPDAYKVHAQFSRDVRVAIEKPACDQAS